MSGLQSLRYTLRGAVSKWFEDPIVGVLQRLGVRPAAITLFGLALSVLAAYFAAIGIFWAAGIIAAFSSVSDMFDGALARRTNSVSKRGALLDSVADRAQEGIILLGLLIHYTSDQSAEQFGTIPSLIDTEQLVAILIFTAFAGSFMVSYVRARAEGLGVSGTSGFLTRPERVVITAVALIVGYPVIGIWILAVGTPLSAIWRFWDSWRTAGKEDG